MSTCGNEDQDQRKNAGTEDSDSMTIEFLRARLLSERSISKTARQRADELAKRVTELEEQLKFVSLQRKKAEKATSDVLSILENYGFSDMSEGFESFSDGDETSHEIMARNASAAILDGPADMKIRKNEVEAYSSSEFESSRSTGRSLSWKSTKNSQYSLEKKKHLDSVRRRASVSSSSSLRRAGKSCRKVRHREPRSPKELQSNGFEQVACCTDLFNCSDGKQYESRKNTECANEKSTENAISCSNSETPKGSRHYFNGHKSYEDMESALQHQLRLIGQYEAEEKAQREWEENFRENNNGQQDSCDPGNHSDVTEERYEMKSAELSYGAGPSSSNRESKHELVDACSSEVPQTSRSMPTHLSSDKAGSQDKTFCGTVACEPLLSEFSFPTSRNTDNLYYPRKPHDGSTELAVSVQQDSNNLGSVLDALQKAKSSLHQKLNNSSALVTVGTSKSEIDNMDRFRVPLTSPGLFRLPTDDFLFQATSINNQPNERLSSAEIGGRRLLSESFVNTSTSLSGANHPDIHAASRLSPDFSNSRFISGHYVYSDALFNKAPHRTVTAGDGVQVPPHMYMGQLEPGAGSAPSSRTSYQYAPEYP